MTDIQKAAAPRFVWGYWTTLGWVVVAFALSAGAGFIAVMVLRPEILTSAVNLMTDGPLISLSTLVSATVQVGVLALAARLTGWPAGEYLGLVRPAGRDAVVAFGALVAFLFAFDAITYLLGRDIVTPFQADTYRSARAAGTLPLMWLAFVVAAPIAEEIIFRGFLFRGWIRSARNAKPGIVVIAALFAIVHVQYDWFGIMQVFLIGLALGWARWRSGSTLLTILMHALINFWGTLQSMVKIEWLS